MHTHTRTTRVFFRLTYCDDCMTHCRIPHGSAGWVLAARQYFFNFFHHWLTFAQHQKRFLSPVYWRKSCGCQDLAWVMFGWWLRQSNMCHSWCRSDRLSSEEMQGGMVADLNTHLVAIFFFHLLGWITLHLYWLVCSWSSNPVLYGCVLYKIPTHYLRSTGQYWPRKSDRSPAD